MAQLGQPFDARNVDPTQTTPSLPVGKHPVVIENSELKENSKKDGGYLQLDLVIIDGPAKGQRGAYRLNLYHSNPQTVEIAHRQLSAVCHCVGVYQLTDSVQLHNIPFIVEIGLQKGDEAKAKGYTQVERVYDRNGNEPGKAGQPAPAAQVQPAPQPAAAAGWGPGAAAPAAAADTGGGQPSWGPGAPAAAAPAAGAPSWGNQQGQQAPQPAAPGAPPWGKR